MKETQRASFTLKGKKKNMLGIWKSIFFLKVKFFSLPSREEINHFDNPNPTLVNSASPSQRTAQSRSPQPREWGPWVSLHQNFSPRSSSLKTVRNSQDLPQNMLSIVMNFSKFLPGRYFNIYFAFVGDRKLFLYALKFREWGCVN